MLRTLVCGLFMMSCSDVTSFRTLSTDAGAKSEGAPASTAAETASSAAPESSNSEAVNPPSNITGTYLHCALVLSASDALPNTVVGCRLDDAANNRVSLSSLAEEAKFSYEGPIAPDVTVLLRSVLNSSARYDAFFEFRSGKKEISEEAALATRIRVDLRNLKSGEASASLSGIVSQVQIPDAPAPNEPPAGTWTSICSGSTCEFKDEASGLIWNTSSTGSMQWNAADAICRQLAETGPSSAWRMPTTTELLQAIRNGIAKSDQSAAMKVGPGPYWTGTRSSGPVAANGVDTVVLEGETEGRVLSVEEVFFQFSLCVRDD